MTPIFSSKKHLKNLSIEYLQHNKKNSSSSSSSIKEPRIRTTWHLDNYYTNNCIKILTKSQLIED